MCNVKVQVAYPSDNINDPSAFLSYTAAGIIFVLC